jgi:NADP-dependent 3-hydroxy acid dehydrogenase YdfG
VRRLTDVILRDQTGKVHFVNRRSTAILRETCQVLIVTGSTSGCEDILASFLNQRNGRVFRATRNTSRLAQLAGELRLRFPDFTTRSRLFHLDLSDLSTTKKSAGEIHARECKFHVIWHNAGL